MGLTNEHVGPKILAKIKIYVLARAELLFNLCYEIPCKKAALCAPQPENYFNIFFRIDLEENAVPCWLESVQYLNFRWTLDNI